MKEIFNVYTSNRHVLPTSTCRRALLFRELSYSAVLKVLLKNNNNKNMSDEQLSRMEENRRRAQVKLSSKRAATQVCAPLPANKKPAGLPAFDCQSQARNSAASSVAPEGKKTAGSVCVPSTAHHSGSSCVIRPSTGRRKGRVRGERSSVVVKVVLSLASRMRFKATANYDQSLIEVFKKVPSKAYGKRLLGGGALCSQLLRCMQL